MRSIKKKRTKHEQIICAIKLKNNGKTMIYPEGASVSEPRANRTRREYIIRCCGGMSCKPNANLQMVRRRTSWSYIGGQGSPLYGSMTPPVFFTRTFTPTVFIPTTPPLFFRITTIFISVSFSISWFVFFLEPAPKN